MLHLWSWVLLLWKLLLWKLFLRWWSIILYSFRWIITIWVILISHSFLLLDWISFILLLLLLLWLLTFTHEFIRLTMFWLLYYLHFTSKILWYCWIHQLILASFIFLIILYCRTSFYWLMITQTSRRLFIIFLLGITTTIIMWASRLFLRLCATLITLQYN